MDVDGTVNHGGFTVQLMPDVSEEDIEILEKSTRGIVYFSHVR